MCAELGGRLPVIRSPRGLENTATSTQTGTASVRKAIAYGATLATEPPLRGRAREIRDDDHPEGLRGEDEDEVHAVRAEEPVSLSVPAELVGEERTRARRCERDHDLREPGESAAAECARCSENVSVRESHRCPTLL